MTADTPINIPAVHELTADQRCLLGQVANKLQSLEKKTDGSVRQGLASCRGTLLSLIGNHERQEVHRG